MFLSRASFGILVVTRFVFNLLPLWPRTEKLGHPDLPNPQTPDSIDSLGIKLCDGIDTDNPYSLSHEKQAQYFNLLPLSGSLLGFLFSSRSSLLVLA